MPVGYTVRHLGTYSPWAKFTGGGSRYGLTREQYEDLKRSAEVVRRRELENLALEKEKLKSAEKVAETRGLADILYGKVGAAGRLAERRLAERGETERAGMATRGTLAHQMLVGAQQKESPEYRMKTLELGAERFKTGIGGAAASVSNFETGEKGETIAVTPSPVQEIAAKYMPMFIAGKEEEAITGATSEIASFKSSVDVLRRQVDNLADELNVPLSKEELSTMTGYSDKAVTNLKNLYRELSAKGGAMKERPGPVTESKGEGNIFIRARKAGVTVPVEDLQRYVYGEMGKEEKQLFESDITRKVEAKERLGKVGSAFSRLGKFFEITPEEEERARKYPPSMW